MRKARSTKQTKHVHSQLLEIVMDPQAQYELARCYMLVGGRGDVKQAFAWLHKAAAEGHPAAHFELGWFYLVGVGAKTDEKQAVLWFVKAASQGYASTHSIRDEIRVQYFRGFAFRSRLSL